EVTADAHGKFEIDFLALPDPSLDPKGKPTFTYRVEVDVTDLSGETQSASSSVRVGYVAMNLGVSAPDVIVPGESPEITLTSSNLNGQPLASTVTLKLYKREDAPRVLRKQVLSSADTGTIALKDWKRMFPYDKHYSEDYNTNRAENEVLWEKQYEIDSTGRLAITVDDLKRFDQGLYRLVVEAKDAFGEEVSAKEDFELIKNDSKDIPRKQVFWHRFEGYRFEPGETARLEIGTALDQPLYGILEVEHQDKRTAELVKIEPGRQSIDFEIKEEHRGGFGFQLTVWGLDEVHSFKKNIYVPWSNKQLKLELATFRSPMLPGSEQEWRITVKGPDGDPVAAELLASMYDKSLDAFASNSYQLGLWPSYYTYIQDWGEGPDGRSTARVYAPEANIGFPTPGFYAPTLMVFGEGDYWQFGYRGRYDRMERSGAVADEASFDDFDSEGDDFGGAPEEMEETPATTGEAQTAAKAKKDKASDSSSLDQAAVEQEPGGGSDAAHEPNFDDVKIRTNLNETAFFYPELRTDEDGNVVFAFEIPEALTEWKLLAQAHTTDLLTGSLNQDGFVTQKPLMITPNAPRFFREGDNIRLTAKLTNMSAATQTGKATLQLLDATTLKPIDSEFANTAAVKDFKLEAGVTSALAWELTVPERTSAVTYLVIAKTDTFSDGEENVLPILPNRMLVNETLPLWINGNSEKEFSFEKLVQSKRSNTLKHHRLTLEFTESPVWYAVQALPYLMEYPHECAEQVFSRLYANSLASHIIEQKPVIKRVFEQWRELEPEALMSNLEKNQELKALVLEETPWLLQAKDESARKRRIALLFDFNRMSNEMSRAVRKLEDMQLSSGAWPWFVGMCPSPWVTRHIVTGLGKMEALDVLDGTPYQDRLLKLAAKGVRYIDGEQLERYRWLKRHHSKSEMETKQHIGVDDIHYLYMRSFYPGEPLTGEIKEMHQYFMTQARTYWAKLGNEYAQAMLATALQQEHTGREGKNGMQAIVKKILVGL
ncbi:MAG: alpha-2-macroglobulin family protein, partial [Bacteroidota bacterium]